MASVLLWKFEAIASYWFIIMHSVKYSLLLLVVLVVISCESEQANIYAIKDFRKSLQPFLKEIVNFGIVTFHDESKIKNITNDELLLLGRSEHPVLRATAIREIFERTSINHFDLLMNHLDDTATIAIDNGEFGIGFETVSDYLIRECNWETAEARNKTIEAVLIKHNYLSSAYNILTSLEAKEKYYPIIKDMATRPRRLDRHDDDYELGFNDIEYALYGLAKFRKKEDIEIIKNKLLQHVWRMSDVSFRLLKEFPDSSYRDVLQEYHRRQFYEFSGNRPHGFSGVIADRAAPEDFIAALVAQENTSSAQLLDSMLKYLPTRTCLPDKARIIDDLISRIWEHPCPAYARLREKVRVRAEELLRGIITIPIDSSFVPTDTAKRQYRWYNYGQDY